MCMTSPLFLQLLPQPPQLLLERCDLLGGRPARGLRPLGLLLRWFFKQSSFVSHHVSAKQRDNVLM